MAQPLPPSSMLPATQPIFSGNDAAVASIIDNNLSFNTTDIFGTAVTLSTVTMDRIESMMQKLRTCGKRIPNVHHSLTVDRPFARAQSPPPKTALERSTRTGNELSPTSKTGRDAEHSESSLCIDGGGLSPVSYSDTSLISGHELITASTQNSPSNLSNLENENNVPSIILSEQSDSDVTYSSGYTVDSGSVDYAWLARCAKTADIPLYERPQGAYYDVLLRDWRRSLSPQRFRDEEIEWSSLSSGESSSESEDAEEINVELPPRYYNNDTNDSLNDEPNSEETVIIIQKCHGIFNNFNGYWGAVRKLAEDRQCIIKKLKKQLSKKRKFNDDQIIHINARLKVIEEMLNSTIPIIPCWKVSYQNGSDKKIIIRKGYIYERIGETNRFKCVYKKNDMFEHCFSFIMIDNSDTIIEGSFCFHHHLPADNEKYTEDVPPAPATPISFCPVTKEEGIIMGKYSKLMKLLKEILIELIDWRCHVVVCLENLKLIHGYLNDLENADDLRLSSRRNNPSLTVLAETKNLLKCIRLDTL